MTIFDVLNLIWGLSLFLFGMNVMGDALERRAGNSLKAVLGKLTKSKMTGFLTGLAVTAVIQSSSATTVMVVGFVNSALMTLKQAINVIMGANIGTTVTAWILSLSGISGDSLIVELFKPDSFTPILALVGTCMVMFGKTSNKKDTGTVLLGFATLMFGMGAMSDSVSGLSEVKAFTDMFIMFKNPILGVLVGAVLTGIIQSSSASVGILQALSMTGSVSFGAAIPIIMGQNIGTCVTALISSVGTTKNARRTAIVHLSFNIIGTVILLSAYAIVDALVAPKLFDVAAAPLGIAVAHSIFNITCTAILLPISGVLEKIALAVIPEKDDEDRAEELDERLLVTPPIALQSCMNLVLKMAKYSAESIKSSVNMLWNYDSETADRIRKIENKTDHYEDIIGAYLVKLSAHQVSDEDSATISKILKLIGDFERISDHSVNVLEAADEMRSKGIEFSTSAKAELKNICLATEEIMDSAYRAFSNNDLVAASAVEPLEEVIDELKDKMRNGHIVRLKNAECTIEAGFIWSDLLTNLERVSDHCSNIAVSVLEGEDDSVKSHEYLSHVKQDGENKYYEQYEAYKAKYTIA